MRNIAQVIHVYLNLIHVSDVLGDAVQKAWDCEVLNARRRGEGCKPSLWKVLFKVFGTELMLYGLILAAMEFLIRSTSTYLNTSVFPE